MLGTDLLRRADASIAGGAVNQLAIPQGGRRVIARGRGPYVWDVDERKYVDYVLGSGPLILGHAHPRVVEAVHRQVSLGSTFYALSRPTIELAERIVDHCPSAELVQFCSTGSEATLYAMRLARAATGRQKILKFEGGFHGSNDYALMSLFPTQDPAYPRPEPSSSGIPATLEREVLVAPFNDVGAFTRILQEEAPNTAAVIVEPIQRTLAPVPGFLEHVRAMTQRQGIVLIFDEVVTGFRVAAGGAQELYQVTPDLATYGKIIGGGYPLAAVAGREDIMRLADHGRRGRSDYVYISGTLNGNPVAATAGLATLDVLDEPGTYDRLNQLGERLRAGLEGVFRSASLPAQVLGVGPIFQTLFTSDPVLNYRDLRRAASPRLDQISAMVLDSGVFLSREKGYVSLAHSDRDIDATIDAFAHAIAQSPSGGAT